MGKRHKGIGYNPTGVIITADIKLDGSYISVSGYQDKLNMVQYYFQLNGSNFDAS